MSKPQFNQKLNSRLRRLIHFRPHGIGWRSFMNLTKALGFETYIKRLSFINKAGFTSSAILFIISLLIIFPIYYKTNLAEAADGPSNTILSISSDNLTAAMDLLVTSGSGTFATSNPLSFNVTTTNSSGYTLSLKSKTGDTDLINSIANSSFTSISGSGISVDVFSDSSNTAYNNHWGIRPSHYESIANSDGLYYPSPDNDGVILNATDKANTSGASDTYTIAIGARATYAQPAGAYSNSYILSAVGNYPRQATCTKQYRLQNADGTFPTEYTLDTTEELDIGTTCTYTKGVTDYKYGGANATNGTEGTTSDTVTEDGVTLSLDFYRNTYALTVSAGSNTSSATGSGTYRWGQTVTVGVTKATNTTCLTYATPTWTQSGTTGTFGSTSGASVNFTMGKGAATVTATSSSSRNTYTITYNKNGGTGTMSSTTGSCGASTTLRANTFTKTNYVFLGWATSSSATTATYTDKQSISLNRTSTLTLYAVWGKLYMQNMAYSSCTTTATTAYDNRDEEAYLIQRLADGKCWLLENLRLNTATASMTTSNTNMKSGTSAKATAATSGLTSKTTAQINIAYKTTEIRSAQSTSTKYKIGIYYNFCAASAGTICANSNSSDASYDICPAGWRLPTGGEKGEYETLYGKYSNFTNFATAFRAPLSGYFSNSTAYGQGTDGSFWSSTRNGSDYMYSLLVDSSSAETLNDMRGNGLSVRCVLKATS